MDVACSYWPLILRQAVFLFELLRGGESQRAIPLYLFNFHQPTPLQNHRQRKSDCRIGDTGRAFTVALANSANATDPAIYLLA
jgi:hypothetical protein